MPAEELEELLAGLSEADAERLMYDWHAWARPNQILPPGNWSGWLNLSGRGSGKTRTGAETVREWQEAAEKPIRIALVAETASDARDVLIEGESGILAISPKWNKPKYETTKRRLTWPNGATAICYSGEEPDQLRGPQFHKGWFDELAKYRYPQETWDNFEFGNRLGDNPQVIITTTPRPIPIIINMVEDKDFVVTRGSSYQNISNLSPKYIKRVIKRYEGTRLGRQELHAEILRDMTGALWSNAMIERNRIKKLPELVRIIVAVDPATTHNVEEGTPNECGVIVGGITNDRTIVVLADASEVLSPAGWGLRCVNLYKLWRADKIIGESNQGGEMVRATIQNVDADVPVDLVWASKGKVARGEPISALSEQDRIKFLGNFPDLENQLTAIMPDGKYMGPGSPDRYDAFVWMATELMGGTSISSDEGDYENDRR